jgi:hypothetical protein
MMGSENSAAQALGKLRFLFSFIFSSFQFSMLSLYISFFAEQSYSVQGAITVKLMLFSTYY